MMKLPPPEWPVSAIRLGAGVIFPAIWATIPRISVPLSGRAVRHAGHLSPCASTHASTMFCV